jgi:methyl-accepting chemotaxis protein
MRPLASPAAPSPGARGAPYLPQAPEHADWKGNPPIDRAVAESSQNCNIQLVDDHHPLLQSARRNTMSLRRSLRGQILTLLGGSLILILLIALACFHFLSGGIQSYRTLVNGTLEASGLVDEANLEFKVQVQEWKNVLLRGKDPESLAKYWTQFEAQEARVQAVLGRLKEKAGELDDAALQAKVDSLRNEHRDLGSAYRRGREAFLAAGADPAAGDSAVKGIDRAASEQMSALVAELHQRGQQQSEAISASAGRTVSLGLAVMLLSSLAIGLLSLWLVSRNLIGPISVLIEHIAQLAQGNFGQRVDASREDELGRLARAANTLRDFLADTFNRLRQSTTQLDSASGELNAIASLMAEGTREQFSRTDQVATAMPPRRRPRRTRPTTPPSRAVR